MKAAEAGHASSLPRSLRLQDSPLHRSTAGEILPSWLQLVLIRCRATRFVTGVYVFRSQYWYWAGSHFVRAQAHAAGFAVYPVPGGLDAVFDATRWRWGVGGARLLVTAGRCWCCSCWDGGVIAPPAPRGSRSCQRLRETGRASRAGEQLRFLYRYFFLADRPVPCTCGMPVGARDAGQGPWGWRWRAASGLVGVLFTRCWSRPSGRIWPARAR